MITRALLLRVQMALVHIWTHSDLSVLPFDATASIPHPTEHVQPTVLSFDEHTSFATALQRSNVLAHLHLVHHSKRLLRLVVPSRVTMISVLASPLSFHFLGTSITTVLSSKPQSKRTAPLLLPIVSYRKVNRRPSRHQTVSKHTLNQSARAAESLRARKRALTPPTPSIHQPCSRGSSFSSPDSSRPWTHVGRE